MKKWDIKKFLKELAIGVLILFVISNLFSYLRKPTLESDSLPPMQVKLLDNTLFSSTDLKDKPIVIHFWATWCPTCKLEAPNIQNISEHYTVLTIAVQSGSSAELQAYMREKNLNFNVLNDTEGKWSKEFHVQAFPTTFIYNSKGKLAFTEVGYTTTAGLLARLKLIE